MRRSHGIRTFFGLGLAVLFAAGGCALDANDTDEDIGTEEQEILCGVRAWPGSSLTAPRPARTP
jgi:hypothetical protein